MPVTPTKFFPEEQTFDMASFANKIFRLGLGNMIAQAISFVAIPIITRLYTPDQYGVFSVYFSVTMILYPASTLQYHSAIMLPKKDEDAVNLFALCVLAVALLSLTLVPGLLLTGQSVGLIDLHGTHKLMWLIPIGVFIQGVGEAVDFWSLRKQSYNGIALSRIGAAVTDRSIGVASESLFQLGALGLVLGRLVGPLVMTVVLISASIRPAVKQMRRALSISEMKRLAIRYKRFPVFSSWAALLQTSANQAPVLLLALMFSPAVAGLYGLAVRVVRLPAMLLADAVGRAYFQRASERVAHGLAIGRETVEMFSIMLYLGLFPTLILAYFGGTFFSLVFGTQWLESGVYVQILVVVFLGLFVNRAIAVLFDVFEKQKERLTYDIGVFVGRAGFLLLGAYIGGTPQMALVGLAFASVIGFAVGWMYLFQLIGVAPSQLFQIAVVRLFKMAPLALGLGWAKAIAGTQPVYAVGIGTAAIVAQVLFLLASDDSLRKRVNGLVGGNRIQH